MNTYSEESLRQGDDCDGMGAVVWMVVSFAVFAVLAIGVAIAFH